jgi:predicted dehydrogenase
VKPVRIAVVGVGHMGKLHLRKVGALQAEAGAGVALAGAVDTDAHRRREAASLSGAPVFADHRDLVGAADAAIVAVPTVSHYRIADDLLRAGLDVLVEKPLAATIDEATRLLELARSAGRVLQVGHLERFNPALQAVARYTRRPLFVEAHRLGPFPDRSTDVDVVRDLMIHDLDIIQRLVGSEPERIEAVGVPVLTDKVDIANARLAFPSGCVANLTASRVSPTPMRKLRFFQSDGYFSLDLLAHSVVVFRRILRDGDPSPHIEMEKLDFDPEDALLAQLRAFVQAVRGRVEPVVPAHEALSALRTALRVVAAMPSLDGLQ